MLKIFNPLMLITQIFKPITQIVSSEVNLCNLPFNLRNPILTNYCLVLILDESAKKKFYDSTVKFLPFLQLDDLRPDTSGIRPKLQGPDEDFRDFVIKEESDLGFPGFINLIGIESPGLTSAPSIARFIRKKICGFNPEI